MPLSPGEQQLIRQVETLRASPAYQAHPEVRQIIDERAADIDDLVGKILNSVPFGPTEWEDWQSDLADILMDILSRVDTVMDDYAMQVELEQFAKKVAPLASGPKPDSLTPAGFPFLRWPSTQGFSIFEKHKVSLLVQSYTWAAEAYERVTPTLVTPSAEEINAILAAIPPIRLKIILDLLERPTLVLVPPTKISVIHTAIEEYIDKVVHKKKNWKDQVSDSSSAFPNGWADVYITEGAVRPLGISADEQRTADLVKQTTDFFLDFNNRTNISLRVHSMLFLAQQIAMDETAGNARCIIDSNSEANPVPPATIVDESEFLDLETAANTITTATYSVIEGRLHYVRHHPTDIVQGIGIRPTYKAGHLLGACGAKPSQPIGQGTTEDDEGGYSSW